MVFVARVQLALLLCLIALLPACELVGGVGRGLGGIPMVR